MNTPYTPPESLPYELSGLTKSKRFWGRTVWASAIAVVVPPMVGLAGTVIGMVSAFGELGKTGQADPADLAGHISLAMLTTMWGLVISLFALIVFAAALTLFLKRRQALRALVPEIPPNKSE